MAVPVTLRANGTVDAGTPVPLFTMPREASSQTAAPDGQKFLLNVSPEAASTTPITVILNWAGGIHAQ